MRAALITGVARSGTSILGEIVAEHPDVYYSFEPDFLWRAPEKSDMRQTAVLAYPARVAEIRRLIKQATPPGKLYLEKNPWNILRLPLVKAALPEIKIVHIVRDGRDVACSMAPGGINHLRTPKWREMAAQYEGPELYARLWQEALEIALADLETMDHHQLRFEDLVADPVGESKRVLDYLELDWHPAVEAYCSLVGDDTVGAYHARRQVEWYVDDHKKRVGRYRENLTAEQAQRVEDAIAPMLMCLGYAITWGEKWV